MGYRTYDQLSMYEQEKVRAASRNLLIGIMYNDWKEDMLPPNLTEELDKLGSKYGYGFKVLRDRFLSIPAVKDYIESDVDNDVLTDRYNMNNTGRYLGDEV